MGTWAAGPFDNDSAADFAQDIHSCSDKDARHDLLLATLRGGSEHLLALGQRGERLDNEYSWGYELEHAVAAAAFVADEFTGVKCFTDTVYAKEFDEDDEPTVYAEFHPPSAGLLRAATLFLASMLVVMRRDGIDGEWVEPVENIADALTVRSSGTTPRDWT